MSPRQCHNLIALEHKRGEASCSTARPALWDHDGALHFGQLRDLHIRFRILHTACFRRFVIGVGRRRILGLTCSEVTSRAEGAATEVLVVFRFITAVIRFIVAGFGLESLILTRRKVCLD